MSLNIARAHVRVSAADKAVQLQHPKCMQGDVNMADLCGLVIVVMVLGEEVNAFDAVW